MKVNDIIRITGKRIEEDYKCSAIYKEYICYVPYLLPLETADVKIKSIKDKTIHAEIVNIISKSNLRINPKCSIYKKCGSCKLLHIPYQESLDLKRNQVENLYKKINTKIKVNNTIGMEKPYNYRNKVIASFSVKNNKIIYGMYEEDTHNVTYNPDCLLQNKKLNEILKTIKEELENLKIRIEGFGGVLRHVMLRIGIETDEVMICFVTNSDIFPGRAELVKRLISKHKEIKTIIQNTNPRNTSVVLGEKMRTLYGDGYINDILLGNTYKISAKSFYQVNKIQTEKLYNIAINLADIKKDDVVFDAYSGIGTISLSASKKAKKVIACEIVKDAVSDAITNSKINRINNVRFYLDDCKIFMRECNERIDTLIIDPPRSGCDVDFLNSIIKLRPKKIVYISCNPLTQVDNIKYLNRYYSINEIQPVDLFPLTQHCEVLTKLTLKD